MKKTILFVDNRKGVLAAAKDKLESSYDIIDAQDEDEAKSKIKGREIDLIVADLRMENERAEDDYSGLRLLGNMELSSPVPIIIYSGNENPRIVRDIFDQPDPSIRPKTYVFKSEGLEVLKSKIRVVLAEEQRIAEKAQLKQEQHKNEHTRMLEAEQKVKSLQQIVDNDIEARRKRQKILSSALKKAGIGAVAVLILVSIFYATDPKLLGGLVSRREMMIGIFSSLTASLLVYIGSHLSRPTN